MTWGCPICTRHHNADFTNIPLFATVQIKRHAARPIGRLADGREIVDTAFGRSNDDERLHAPRTRQRRRRRQQPAGLPGWREEGRGNEGKIESGGQKPFGSNDAAGRFFFYAPAPLRSLSRFGGMVGIGWWPGVEQ